LAPTVRIATGDWLIATGIAGAWLACALLAGGYFRATTVPLAALAISALALVGSVRRLRRPSVVVLALLFLATWTAASGLWGPADSLSVASLPILYAATLWLAEQGDGRASLHALRIAILMITGLALAARALTLAPMAGGSSTRLEWPVTYANGLGLIAATGVLLWAGLPTGRVYLGHAAIAVCLTTTCLTFSRSAIIGLAAALLLLLAGRRRLSRRATVTAVAAALLSCAILGPALWARFAAPFPVVVVAQASGAAIWGRTPSGLRGRVLIQTTTPDGWRDLGSLTADKYGVFQGRVHGSLGTSIRAVLPISGDASGRVRVAPFADHFYNPFGTIAPLELGG